MKMTRQIIILCDLTPYSLVDCYQISKENHTSILRVEDESKRFLRDIDEEYQTTQHHIPSILPSLSSSLCTIIDRELCHRVIEEQNVLSYKLFITFSLSLANHCADPLPSSLWCQSFQTKLWYKVSPSWNFNLLLLFVNLIIPLLI
jgi:hypothetical protein